MKSMDLEKIAQEVWNWKISHQSIVACKKEAMIPVNYQILKSNQIKIYSYFQKGAITISFYSFYNEKVQTNQIIKHNLWKLNVT